MLNSSINKAITEKIRAVLLRRTALIGIGNTFRKDDGAGIYIADNLTADNRSILIVSAGENLENYVEEITVFKPESVVIFDCANFGGAPGEIRIIDKNNIPVKTVSSHSIPVKLIADLLETETQAEIILIGIQGKNFDYGEGLSCEVKTACDSFISLLSAEMCGK